MQAQIAKYRAEAADYRNREAQARAEGRMNDAASYASTAHGRELLADALEMEHDVPTDEMGTHEAPERCEECDTVLEDDEEGICWYCMHTPRCYCDPNGPHDCTYMTGGSGYL